MICPKCGFEQPDSPECARCGIIVGRYKGSVAGGAAAPASIPPAPPPPVAASAVGTVFSDPEPVAAGGGTLYGGPPPGAAGGTVYQGPAPGSQPRPRTGSVITVMRKLRMGETLSQSFLIFFKNLIPFLILTAVAFSPVYLFGDYLVRRAAASNPAVAAGLGSLVGLATALFCIPLSTGMITYGVFQEMRGGELSLGSCLSVGFSSLLSVLSVAFLQILFVMGAVIGTVIPVLFLIRAVASGGTRSSAACGLMLVPLLVLAAVGPAIMLWLRFFVAVPAAVEERPGALSALRRSAYLTEGQRWPIFGIVLTVGVLNFGLQLGAVLVPVAGPFLYPVSGLLTTALVATTCAVIYYRLRSFHESIDVDQIASVFA